MGISKLGAGDRSIIDYTTSNTLHDMNGPVNISR